MDTIIFVVLLVGGIVAYKGMSSKIVIPVFVLGILLTALLYHHHVTSRLTLEF